MIARHLLDRAPAAILIPASVCVDAFLVDISKEFTLLESGHDGPYPEPARDRVFLGTVFELSAETVKSWSSESGHRLPGAEIRIPCPLEKWYDPLLFTRVRVYKDHLLADHSSGLTVPRPFPFEGALNGGETLDFHYCLGSHPALVCNKTDQLSV